MVVRLAQWQSKHVGEMRVGELICRQNENDLFMLTHLTLVDRLI